MITIALGLVILMVVLSVAGLLTVAYRAADAARFSAELDACWQPGHWSVAALERLRD